MMQLAKEKEIDKELIHKNISKGKKSENNLNREGWCAHEVGGLRAPGQRCWPQEGKAHQEERTWDLEAGRAVQGVLQT